MRHSNWSLLFFIGIFGLAICSGILTASAQGEPPVMPPLPDGLEPPPTVYPPTQISEGAYTYYQVCMACHGDKGQGLTDEWRGALDPPDQNCWQSRCHAANHPADGFVFPKIVPALASPGMLARFDTALDLFHYLQDEMPFQAPGSLSETEYWQLTAFLLSLNRIDPGDLRLDAERAAELRLREQVTGSQTAVTLSFDSHWWVVLAAVLLALVLVAWVWIGRASTR